MRLQHLEVGATLNQYEVLKVLGAGGFGVTYLARDETLGRLVAIKEYFPDSFAVRHGATVRARTLRNDDFVWGKQRFLGEARMLARFDHPNLTRVVQIFEANDTVYIVLEYLRGRLLQDWLREIGGAPTQSELDLLAKGVLGALEMMHRNDVLHRDVAPDNIIICDDGR